MVKCSCMTANARAQSSGRGERELGKKKASGQKDSSSRQIKGGKIPLTLLLPSHQCCLHPPSLSVASMIHATMSLS